MAATTPGKMEPMACAIPVRKKTRKARAPAASARRRLITDAAPRVAVPGIEPGRVLPRWILSPLRLPVPPDGLQRRVLSTPARRGKIRAGSRVDLCSQSDAFAQCRMRMNRAPDVLRIGSHLDGQADLRDQLAGIQSDDASADGPPGRLVEQQLDEAVLAPVGDRPAARGPGEHRLAIGFPALLQLVLGCARPGDLRIRVRHGGDLAGIEGRL